MQTHSRRPKLTWRQTVTRFSYYSLGIGGLWVLAFVVSQFFAVHPH